MEMQETGRSRTTSITLTPEGSGGPSARMPYSHPTDSNRPSMDQEPRAAGSSPPDGASSKAGSGVSTQSVGTQRLSRPTYNQTSGSHSDEEKTVGLSKVFAPLQRTSHRYSSLDKNDALERPAMSRASTVRFNENDEFLPPSKESFTITEAASPRASDAGSMRLPEFARGYPLLRPESNRALSDYDPESVPGTPFGPPSTPWGQPSSLGGSSIWLDPNSGRASPVSMASSAYVSVSYSLGRSSLTRTCSEVTNL